MSRLRVALIGAGHISGAHLAGWRKSGAARVVGILDLDREAAARRAARHGVDRIFTDLAEACAAADIVDVCTPPGAHASILRVAGEAGRHVLVEKPVVTDAREWRELRPRFSGSGPRLGVVHNLKFTRSVSVARRWLAEGRIGRLLRLRHQFLTGPGTDRMLAAPHWSHALPGGRWFETLPHALYLTHHLAGPLTVRSVTALPGSPPVLGAHAGEVLVGLAGDGVLATFHYSAACAANRRTLVLEGETGVITVDVLSDSALLERGFDSRWRRAIGPEGGGALRRLAAWPVDRGAYLADRLRGITPHVRMIRQFARQLADGGPEPTPLTEIDYVIEQSERIGREIDHAVTEADAG